MENKSQDRLRNRLAARILLSLIFLCAAVPNGIRAAGFDHTHETYDKLLKSHVADGWVDYTGLQRDSKDLDAYLEDLAAVSKSEFKKWPQAQRLAFLINLYNAQTLRLILDNYGKIKSIKDTGSFMTGPWDLKIVRFLGETITLNKLEHKIIRKRYTDPRAHFALVCASISCPPLREEAFSALGKSSRSKTRLDMQLQDQGKRFLADKEKNRYDAESKTLYLSPVFKWFKKDFTSQSGSLVSFVLPYLPREASRNLLRDRNEVNIEFTDYDWDLNDRASRKDHIHARGD